MARLVAFLRAVNVGGRVVPMSTLRAHFGAMGFEAVETFIASGNVVFTTAARPGPALERRVAAELASRLGYEVPTIIRGLPEVAAVIARQPFSAADLAAFRTLQVGLLASVPAPAARRLVLRLATPDDLLAIRGRELYWLTRKGMTDSAIGDTPFERLLGTTATFRNMNTLRRLVDRFGPPGGRAR